MAVAKSSASIAATLMLILFLIFHWEIAHAAPVTYKVGDEFGWSTTIDMESWPRGKTFYAGDVLWFQYDPQEFDLVVLDDKEAHDTCTVTQNSTKYIDGDNKITLAFGVTYYMCSIQEDCEAGMKMAINATTPPPSP